MVLMGTPMLLSIEYNAESEELSIVCDGDGIDSLIGHLNRLKGNGGHTHLMTPAWAGSELTEERHAPDGILINHVRVVLSPPTTGGHNLITPAATH